jgi:hypothetical protein
LKRCFFGFRVQIDMWKSEVSKLNRRYADEMNARIHGDKFGGHRSTDV